MAENRLSSIGVQTLGKGKANSTALLSSVGVQALMRGGSANARLSSLMTQVLVSTAEAPPPPYAFDAIGYEGFGGSGARRAIFDSTVVTSGSFGQDAKRMFDGYRDNSFYWTDSGGGFVAGRAIAFSFPSPRIIEEFTLYCDSPGAASTMLWSFDGFDTTIAQWVSLASFGYTTAGPIVVPINSAGKAYAGYRLIGISGQFQNEHWWRNFDFKTSYQIGESGDRSAIVAVTTNTTNDHVNGSFAKFFDGVIGSDTNNSWHFRNVSDVTGLWFEWQFTEPHEILAAYHGTNGQSNNSQGTWKFQGWDGAAWQDLLTFNWIMDNSTPWVLSNTMMTDRYRVIGQSGSANAYHWENELYFEFAQPAASNDVTIPATTVTDDGGIIAFPLTIYDPGPGIPDVILPAVTIMDDDGLTVERPHIGSSLPPVTIRDDLGVTAKPLRIRAPRPQVRFPATTVQDDLGITAKPLRIRPRVALPAVTFTDDGGLQVRPPQVTVDLENDAIGGPFIFHWTNEGEVFSSAIHGVPMEDVFAWQMQQEEGDFAQLTVQIRNPRVGLLKTGRPRWCFFSYQFPNGYILPMFYGRLIGVPANVFSSVITLAFIARPFDFAARKAALAESLRTLPYFDPIFIDPDAWEDDDMVLEARTALYHTDRVTHEVTISDLVTPEDGIYELTEDDVDVNGVALSLNNAPLRAVQIQSTVPWTLNATGAFDLVPYIMQPQFWQPYNGYDMLASFTFDGLASSWPKEGSKLGEGWSAIAGKLDNVAFSVVPEIKIGPPFDASTIPVAVAEGSIVFPVVITDGEYHSGEEAGFNINVEQVVVPIGYGYPQLVAGYEAEREMGQEVLFTMVSEVQDVLTLAPEADVKTVTINANPVSDVTRDGSIPIGDSRRRDYLRTERGQQSMKHLMLIARANLVNGTRVAQTNLPILDFELALQIISLRKGILYNDRRFPGKTVVGKIASYSFSLEGDGGDLQANVTLLSTVGRGGAYEEQPGDGVYAAPGYMQRHYQQEANTVELSGVTEDLAFTVPPWVQFDDGVDFLKLEVADAVVSFGWHNTPQQQYGQLIGLEGADQGTVSATLQLMPTQATIKMISMKGGPFAEQVGPVVANLLIPKQIDLEAESDD